MHRLFRHTLVLGLMLASLAALTGCQKKDDGAAATATEKPIQNDKCPDGSTKNLGGLCQLSNTTQKSFAPGG